MIFAAKRRNDFSSTTNELMVSAKQIYGEKMAMAVRVRDDEDRARYCAARRWDDV